MIVKIHKTGTSFVGATRYVIHDKRASTSHRVAWAETVNVGTDNPEAAARVMAFVAMDAGTLKEEAGVKNTGRKSNQHVFHATLSWPAAEAPKLTKEHQLSAAAWFLRKLGADDRQAIIVAHTDQKNAPHVHIIANRVSPIDGRLLSSSMEKLKSSQWALAYERSQGEIQCHQRAINANARGRDHYTRGVKGEPRHFREMRQQAGNNKELLATLEAEKAKMKKAYHAQKSAEREAQQRREQMDRRHRERLRTMRADAKKEITKSRQRVRDGFAGEWEKEYYEAETQRVAFAMQEKEFLGRMKNSLRGFQFRDVVGRDRIRGRVGVISEAFKALGDSGLRLELLKRQQDYREQLLRQKQNLSVVNAVQEARRELATRLREASRIFTAEREAHDAQSRIRQHELAADVRRIGRERYRTWRQALLAQKTSQQARQRPSKEAAKIAPATMPTIKPPFQEAAAQTNVTTSAGDQQMPRATKNQTEAASETVTRPEDLLPRKNADEFAGMVDQHKRREAFKRRLEEKRQQDQDRGGRSY